MKNSTLRGLYFGVHDASYPRNRRLREFLGNQGHDIDVVVIDASNGYVRNFVKLARHAVAPRPTVDYVLLSEFSIQFAVIAWIAARRHRAVLVVDWYVGLFETRVEDHSADKVTPLRKAQYRLLDRIAARIADLVVTDTEVRATALSKKYALRDQPFHLPVGAPSWAMPASPVAPEALAITSPPAPLRLLFYGNFLPLHGVPVILEALHRARRSAQIHLTLVGQGVERAQALQLCDRLDLKDACTFIDSVPEFELRGIIRDHDVVLGIFGGSPKAKSVIANKVWQGLACGKRVLTRESSALAEISELVGAQLLQVADSEGELAEALVAIALREDRDIAFGRPDLVLESYVREQYSAFGRALVVSCEDTKRRLGA